MSATSFFASLVLAQAAVFSQAPSADPETIEVAYEQISIGDLESALAVLEDAHRADPSDPAVLINLGSVHQQLGQLHEAQLFYTAALESGTRYEMELANGRWLDSRQVAMLALDTLEDLRLAQR